MEGGDHHSGGSSTRWWNLIRVAVLIVGGALAMDSSGREGDPVAPRWRGEGGEM
jgi:hypothetical protein